MNAAHEDMSMIDGGSGRVLFDSHSSIMTTSPSILRPDESQQLRIGLTRMCTKEASVLSEEMLTLPRSSPGSLLCIDVMSWRSYV